MIEEAMAIFDQMSEANQQAWGDNQVDSESSSVELQDHEESLRSGIRR